MARPDGEVAGEDDDSVSQGGLSKILSGKRSNPGIFTVKAIADAANVTVGELLGERLSYFAQHERLEFERALELLSKAADATNEARAILVSLAAQPEIEETPSRRVPSEEELLSTEEGVRIALGGAPNEAFVNIPGSRTSASKGRRSR